MLTPYIFGLNYQTAPFDLRQKLAVPYEEIPLIIKRLQGSGITKEVLVLSTCNRTEIYCITNDIEFVINALCDIKNICPRSLRSNCYTYSGVDCAKHLFKVISGLDSMVLGETQIVNQIKKAFNLSHEHNAVATHLSGLFQIALSVEKDVRNTVEINHSSLSIGRAVAEVINGYIPNQDNQKILFVGSGQMMHQIAPYFSDLPQINKMVANRTLSHAQILADRINSQNVPLIDLPDIAKSYNVVIACIDSHTKLLTADLFADQIKHKQPLLIIDLSVPMISDVNLQSNPSIKLLSIDDIAKKVDVGTQKRKIAAAEAENLITDKLELYQNWLNKRQLSPIIKALRDNAEEVRLEILENAKKQLSNGNMATDVLEEFSVKLVNRLLHLPTTRLCESSGELQAHISSAISYIYDLEVN